MLSHRERCTGSVIVGFLAASILGGCGEPTTAACGVRATESAAAAAIEAEREAATSESEPWPHVWAPSIERLIQTAPPDSVARVVFQPQVGQAAFLQILEAHGGELLYAFQTVYYFSTYIPVGGLEGIITNHIESFLWIGAGPGMRPMPQGC